MDFYSQNNNNNSPGVERSEENDRAVAVSSKSEAVGANRKSVIRKLSMKSKTRVKESVDKSDSIANKRKRNLSESSSSDDGRGPPDPKRPAAGEHAGQDDIGLESRPSLGFYSSAAEYADTNFTASKSKSMSMPTSSVPPRKRKQVPDEVRQPKHSKESLEEKNVPLNMISAPTAERMMQKMGYKPGTGLGRLGDGIKEPIEAKPRAAKSGLGFSIPGLELGKQDWNFEAEEIIIEEQIDWIPPPAKQPQWTLDALKSWRVVDKENLDISACTDFCDGDVLHGVLNAKNTLDQMDQRDFNRARFRSNPFETIGKAIFMNRAALKMANLDAIMNFQLTMDGDKLSEQELFYFADVCAGPGGFSEYVLWKKGWRAKGFGFTLKGDCDFKLADFVAGTPETFEPHYGVNDNGDIFDPVNIDSFISYVQAATDKKGVHLFMADGGFSVDGQENIQEILSKQLYLSQIVVALAILRQGGNFICKLFDIFTPFSVGLIYLLRACFDGVAIHKPNTSRPANSERYVLCKGRKPIECVEPVRKYLLDTHDRMWNLAPSRNPENTNPKRDVIDLVPLHMLLNDEEFHTYIYNSNNQLGARQIQNLQKIVAFYRDQNLLEKRQQETKIKCLEFWQVPNERRRFPGAGGYGHGHGVESPQARFYDLLKSDDAGFIRRPDPELTMSSMRSTFRSPCDWAVVIVAGDKNRSKRGFYLGLGGTKVHRFTGIRWEPIDIKLELPKDTIVYGEIVDEVSDINRPTTSRRVAFHIIDAMMLGGEDLRTRDFWERHRTCALFAKAVNKPIISTLAPVRVKQVLSAESIGQNLLHGLSDQPMGSKIYVPIDLSDEGANKVLAGGLLFLKLSTDDWMIARSKRHLNLYYYNIKTRYSGFEPPPDVYADFKYTMSKKVVWWWDGQTHFGQEADGCPDAGERVHIAPFLKFMQSIPS